MITIIAEVMEENCGTLEAEANARLNAESPNMLALLKTISMNNWIPQQIDEEIRKADPTWDREAELAKAEGK